MTEIVIKIGLH